MSTETERTQIAVLQNDMSQVKSDISEMKGDLKIIKEGLDSKYAAKWVQQIVGGLIALILIAFLTALIALVIIPASKKNADGTTPESPASTSQPSSNAANPTAKASAKATADGKTDSQTSTNPVGEVLDSLPKVKVGN